MNGFKRHIVPICLLASIFVAAACSPVVETRGHVRDDEAVANVKPGMGREEVLQLLGSPSSVASFGTETWYYMYARKEHIGFMKPKIVEQQVTQIEFDSGGTVTAVKGYDEKAGRKIAMNSRTTPTEGHSMGVLEQVLGNVGRFNKPKEEAR